MNIYSFVLLLLLYCCLALSFNRSKFLFFLCSLLRVCDSSLTLIFAITHDISSIILIHSIQQQCFVYLNFFFFSSSCNIFCFSIFVISVLFHFLSFFTLIAGLIIKQPFYIMVIFQRLLRIISDVLGSENDDHDDDVSGCNTDFSIESKEIERTCGKCQCY